MFSKENNVRVANSCQKYFMNIYLLCYHCANCWRRRKSSESWWGRWRCAARFQKNFQFVMLKCRGCRAFDKELSSEIQLHSLSGREWLEILVALGCPELHGMASCTQRVRESQCLLGSPLSTPPESVPRSDISVWLILSCRLTNRSDNNYFG